MHSQVLVITPFDMKLEDLMYWYQEVDKNQNGKISDERCRFFLTIPEEEIPSALNSMIKELKKIMDKRFEVLKYRSEHTYAKSKEKYGSYVDECLKLYTYYCDKLNELNKIRKLPIDDPNQIKYIKEHACWYIGKTADIYIKGKGYGTFHNPYELWDYYQCITKRLGNGVRFLINEDGEKSNQMYLNELDIHKTVANIKEFTYVWEYIIFCEKKPSESEIYTIDNIKFKSEWNKHCLVDNLEDVLMEISENPHNDQYMVTAIDVHY